MVVRRLLLALLVFGVAACSALTGPGSVVGTGPGFAVGTYTLQTINQQGLPVRINEEGRPLVLEESGDPFLFEITAGVAILNEDWTCSLSLTKRETVNGIAATYVEAGSCTYTIAPTGFRGLEMFFDDGFEAGGSVSIGGPGLSSTLTLMFSGVNPPAYVFQT